MANSYICGGLTFLNAIQAARLVQKGCEVRIIRGNVSLGVAVREADSYRLGDHTLSIAHTDTTRLAVHLEGFATV